MTEKEKLKLRIEHEIALLENQTKYIQNQILLLKQQLEEMEQTEINNQKH